jgi:hypothetical protein
MNADFFLIIGENLVQGYNNCMITLSTARQLKEAGLTWIPALHDFFAVPDRGLDDRVFVISDMHAYVEIRNNLPVVTFHGVLEWALDYLLTEEVIWLPREEQLRGQLMRQLASESQPSLSLTSSVGGYACEIIYEGEIEKFESQEASEAYAAALLYILRHL